MSCSRGWAAQRWVRLSTAWTTTTGITVQAKGGGAAFRGLRVGPRRPDLIICDDIEKDEQVASAARRQKLEDWLRKVVMPALAPDGQLAVLGEVREERVQGPHALLQVEQTFIHRTCTSIPACSNGRVFAFTSRVSS